MAATAVHPTNGKRSTKRSKKPGGSSSTDLEDALDVEPLGTFLCNMSDALVNAMDEMNKVRGAIKVASHFATDGDPDSIEPDAVRGLLNLVEDSLDDLHATLEETSHYLAYRKEVKAGSVKK